MAVKQITASLVATHLDGRSVTSKEFLEPLKIDSDSRFVRVAADRPKGMSALIEFFHSDIAAHRGAPERYVSFDNEVASSFDSVGTWLGGRVDALQSMANNGLRLLFIVEIWINQDQMELVVPPAVLLACGQAGIRLQVISND